MGYKWSSGGKKKGKNKGAKKEFEPAKQEETEEFKLARGAVLKLAGLGGEVTREDIKEVLKETFEVNIDKGEWVRGFLSNSVSIIYVFL